MNNYTVVFSSDDNYIVPTYVAIHSLLYHARRNDCYDVYVLAPGNLMDSSKDTISSIEKEFTNLKIHFINLGDAFSSSSLFLDHTSIPTMYRLLLPSLLPDCDKCLYLDGDILVTGDMSELFDIDMEGYYVGGVRDIEADICIKKFDYDCTPPDCENYINAGLLLMNLRLMREDGIEQKFMEYAGKKLMFADQDIVNIVCHGKIRFLELKFNTIVKYTFVNYKQKHYSSYITDKFPIQEIYDAIDHPVMIHYAQAIKPWQCRYVYKGEKWYRYIKKNVPDNIYREHILPYIKKYDDVDTIKRRIFLRWILYKLGIFRLVLNKQHRL